MYAVDVFSEFTVFHFHIRYLHHFVTISQFRRQSIAIPDSRLVTHGGDYPRDDGSCILETSVRSEH